MIRRVNWLLLVALAVVGVSLFVGCSQPDDLLTPISKTSLTLSVQMLPNCPDSMVYELWVIGEADTVSVGKFAYDLETRRFLNEAGNTREDGAVFTLEGDVRDYETMIVSIETVPDNDLLSPGPWMLMDEITNTNDDLIQLVFPLSDDSLWDATCRYNMRSVSDTARGSNVGVGLWLATYATAGRWVQDTVAIQSWVIDTVGWWMDEQMGGVEETTVVVDFHEIGIVTDTLKFGTDTLNRRLDWYIHHGLYFDDSTETFTSEPYLITTVDFVLDTLPSVEITWDVFTQDFFLLPDYTQFGWHYKTWAVAPTITFQGFSVGAMTLPAWAKTQTGLDRIPGYGGGMISAGTFTDITSQDDDSAHYAIFSDDYPPEDPALLPFVYYAHVPDVPGEEFFNAPMTAGGTGTLNLLAGGNSGTVFISLEPNNFVTDTTNFPLIPFYRHFPYFVPDLEDKWQESMTNATHTNDPFWGFPKVTVEVRRF